MSQQAEGLAEEILSENGGQEGGWHVAGSANSRWPGACTRHTDGSLVARLPSKSSNWHCNTWAVRMELTLTRSSAGSNMLRCFWPPTSFCFSTSRGLNMALDDLGFSTLSRREMLRRVCRFWPAGIGRNAAISRIVGGDCRQRTILRVTSLGRENSPSCIIRQSAKRVIFLFMNGGPSHVDTFDPKPALAKHDGEQPPETLRTERRRRATCRRRSVRAARAKRRGDERAVPAARHACRRLCVIRSMHTDVPNHEPGCC